MEVKPYKLHCEIVTTILASYMLEYYDCATIINTSNHSVCYVNNDSWDLTLGLVFRGYKYPDLVVPQPEFIPSFRHFFDEINFDIYYSKKSLLEANKKSIQYKVISNAR
jgi:hypothetical protein